MQNRASKHTIVASFARFNRLTNSALEFSFSILFGTKLQSLANFLALMRKLYLTFLSRVVEFHLKFSLNNRDQHDSKNSLKSTIINNNIVFLPIILKKFLFQIHILLAFNWGRFRLRNKMIQSDPYIIYR